MDSVRIAFEGGYTNIKLYFMMGLPTETMEDVEGVYELAKAVIEEFYATPNHAKAPWSCRVAVNVHSEAVHAV